ncbi:MAG: peroxiredoxin [Caulobacteraceae bacterium]
MTVDVGSKAPAFDMATDTGRVSLEALKGKTVVLYFYPKDDTPGCTNEGKDFSALLPQFGKAGAVVIGCSKDSVKAHAKFRAKYDLTVELASDPEGQVIDAYGSWVEKSLYGRQYMGIDRSTFVVDGQGVIRAVWHKVKVAGHAEAVLKTVQGL